MTFLPQRQLTTISAELLQRQLTAAGFLQNCLWLCCFLLWFYSFQSKNQNKSKLIQNSTKLYSPSLYIFLELSAKNQIKIQFLDRRFDVLNFRRVKNSYLICPLSKNSNFFAGDVVFCSKHECKKAWKSSTSWTLFRTRTWKKLRFCMVRSKNRNKSRLSRNATKLYRHLYKNTYRWCAKFRNIPNKCRCFYFF